MQQVRHVNLSALLLSFVECSPLQQISDHEAEDL